MSKIIIIHHGFVFPKNTCAKKTPLKQTQVDKITPSVNPDRSFFHSHFSSTFSCQSSFAMGGSRAAGRNEEKSGGGGGGKKSAVASSSSSAAASVALVTLVILVAAANVGCCEGKKMWRNAPIVGE
jgi:hypothetical protein